MPEPPDNPSITFIESRIAAEPPGRAAALRNLLGVALQAPASADKWYEPGCSHSASEIAAGECDTHDPDEFGLLAALAALWAGQPGYDPKWAINRGES